MLHSGPPLVRTQPAGGARFKQRPQRTREQAIALPHITLSIARCCSGRARAITHAVVPKKNLPGAMIIGASSPCLRLSRSFLSCQPSRILWREDAKVAAGQQVTITIPDGASGDDRLDSLRNHIVENPKDYYAAVKKLNADMSLKPVPICSPPWTRLKVVQQLMEGPNARLQCAYP
ncbi:MAG: hypothetical protein ACLRM9_02915 [Collinsella aerofaciens]